MKRHPTVLQLALPVSRRLNADTVSIIQPAFYPGHAVPRVERDRSIHFDVAGIMPFDAALDGVAAGASIVMVELPPQIRAKRTASWPRSSSIRSRLLLRRARMSDARTHLRR